MKILIVAKADALRNGLQTLLSAVASNAEIDVVDNPALATRIIRQNAVRLVFFYPGLPFADLLAAAIRVKRTCPKVFCVIVIEDREQAHLALEAGINRVILKGFNLEQLVEIFDAAAASDADPGVDPQAQFSNSLGSPALSNNCYNQ